MVVTDLVYHEIRGCIASHAPERGGALYGPKGYPFVTHFEYDMEGETSAVSYVPSTRLIINVPKVEMGTGLQFKGIIHSHPRGLTRPSSGDEQTVAAFFRLNPHISFMALPIVQQAYPNDIDTNSDFLHWYRAERRRETGHGTAVTVPRLTRSARSLEIIIVEEEYYILPILEHVEAIVSKLQSMGYQLTISRELQHVKMQNADLIGLVATSSLSYEFMFFASLDYPVVAPLIIYQQRGETKSLIFPWDGMLNLEKSLNVIVELLRDEWSTKIFGWSLK